MSDETPDTVTNRATPSTPAPDRITLPGSHRDPVPGFTPERELSPDESVAATVVLRRRPDGQPGADPDDVTAVSETLAGLGLQLDRVDAPSRRIRVSGPAATVAAAFGTELSVVSSSSDASGGARTVHRQRTGELSVPATIAERVLAVLGLDDRPQARSQFRMVPAAAVGRAYTPVELGTAYRFPAQADGSGQTVAIVELGGGFDQADLDTYFSALGVPSPTVRAVGVDGAANRPGGDPQGADGEVLLDVEVVGALAPGATVVVYFAPNSDAGFVDAVSEALHADPTPAAISISWGQSEDAWTAQARNALDSVFADAVTMGVVVTAAAGDNGSSDGAGDGTDHVDFPAASPNVLACGGTRLQASGSTIDAETVWNDGSSGGATGGGISDTFPRPARQASLGLQGSGRGVPDVAGNADPQTGYRVRVDGQDTVIGGTSAVAPLWAALVARLAQATGGPLHGFLDRLYTGAAAGNVPSGFRDVTSGDNGSYSAGPGWDACTGLGSPDGDALLTRLSAPAQ